MICEICKLDFDVLKEFHYHISKKHKIKISDYYSKNFPRFDLCDGSLILFKNFENYFCSFFNSRTNLVKFLSSGGNPTEAVTDLLSMRKNIKKLVYAPSTVEARSVISLPTPLLCEKLNIDYNKICLDLGLKIKYDYKQQIKIQADSHYRILCDSREQHPVIKGNNVTITALDCADYTMIKDGEDFSNIFVEFKRGLDFIGSFTKQIDRLKEEFSRARDNNWYIVIVCEYSLGKMLELEKSDYFRRFTRVSSDYLFHRVRECCQEFENVQFAFKPDKIETGNFIKRILLIGKEVREIDLQWAVDKNLL